MVMVLQVTVTVIMTVPVTIMVTATATATTANLTVTMTITATITITVKLTTVPMTCLLQALRLHVAAATAHGDGGANLLDYIYIVLYYINTLLYSNAWLVGSCPS